MRPCRVNRIRHRGALDLSYAMFGNSGRLPTRFPVAICRQYPRDGRGTFRVLQIFAKPTSERLYFVARVRMRSAHTSSYASADRSDASVQPR